MWTKHPIQFRVHLNYNLDIDAHSDKVQYNVKGKGFYIMKILEVLKVTSLTRVLTLAAVAVVMAAAPPALAAAADSRAGEDDDRPGYSGYILRIDEENAEAEIAELEAAGVKVLYRRGDLILTFVPDDPAEVEDTEFEKLNGKLKRHGVKGVDLARRNRKIKQDMRGLRDALNKGGKARDFDDLNRNVPTMDKARSLYDADKILTGSDDITPYDGSGVVVGFCDIGFDARHVNFKYREGKECRVRLAVDYDEYYGERHVYATPEAIYDWETDTEDNFHATHVGGIMAGACVKSGFHGMAPGADIVATTSRLTDVGILAGVEDIIAYAKSVGKPAVVNLSVGSYLGPHDGTSLFCQYIDRCAEDALICISSGNEGGVNNHVRKTLTESAPRFQTLFGNSRWDNYDMYGASDFYSSDSRPFKVRVFLYSATNRNVRIFETPLIDFEETPEWALTSNPEYAGLEGFHYSEEFGKYFSGEVYLWGELDPDNGRYHVQVYRNCATEAQHGDNPWALYRICCEIEGEPGAEIDGFCDSTRSWFNAYNGTFPDTDMCVSDLATAHNVISVGMYYSAEGVMRENGEIYKGGEPMRVHGASGYGVLRDGRTLPLTVAPGSPIVSSMSTPYVRKHGSGDSSYKLVHGLENDLSEYYWMPFAGTSMSTPYVAGVIATWLEASPQLKYDEAQRIISAVNEREEHSFEADRHNGEGFFRPYMGLQEVLKGVASSCLEYEDSHIKVVNGDGKVTVMNPENTPARAVLYSVDGQVAAEMRVAAGEMQEISLTAFPKGIYIMTVSPEDRPSSATKLKIIR